MMLSAVVATSQQFVDNEMRGGGDAGLASYGGYYSAAQWGAHAPPPQYRHNEHAAAVADEDIFPGFQDGKESQLRVC